MVVSQLPDDHLVTTAPAAGTARSCSIMREALAFTAYLTLGPIPPDDSLLTDTSRRSVPRIGVCPPEAIRAANTKTLARAIVRHHLEHQDRQEMWGPHGKAALEILQRIEQRLAAIPPATRPLSSRPSTPLQAAWVRSRGTAPGRGRGRRGRRVSPPDGGVPPGGRVRASGRRCGSWS